VAAGALSVAFVIRHSIRTKLLVGLVVVLLMVGSLTSGSLVAVYAYRDTIGALDQQMDKLALVDALRLNVAGMMAVSAARLGEDPKAFDELAVQLDNSASALHDLQQHTARSRPLALPPEFLKAETASLHRARQDLKVLAERVQQVKRERRLVERRFLDRVLTPVVGPMFQPDLTTHLRRLYADVSALDKAIRQNGAQLLTNARQAYRASRAVVFATAATVVVLIVGLVFAFYRWIFRPILHLHTGQSCFRVADSVSRTSWRIRSSSKCGVLISVGLGLRENT